MTAAGQLALMQSSRADDYPFGGFGAARTPAALPLAAPIVADESAIPPRQWLGGPGCLPRGRMAVLSGPPGVSKTTFALHAAMALATGEPWAGIIAEGEPTRILFGVVEDDIEEIRRRVHAAAPLICDHPRKRELLARNLSIVDLSEAVPLIEVTREGLAMPTAGMDNLEATIRAVKPELLILDPLIEMHSAEENANHAMRAVMQSLRRTFTAHSLTSLTLHHETKSAQGEALQRLRGAGAIGGAVRMHWSLRQMTAEEAAEFGIPEDTRDLYLRVETGKQQYARRNAARWLVIEDVELANGDTAHRLVPWLPPRLTITPEVIATAIECIRHGRGGEPLTTSNRSPACYRRAFADAGIPAATQAELLDALLSGQHIALKAWRDPEDRKLRKRLWAPGSTLPGWCEDET